MKILRQSFKEVGAFRQNGFVKVKVVDVNTVRVKGKEKRMGRSVGKTSDYKKAIVQLAEGDSIEIFEGL